MAKYYTYGYHDELKLKRKKRKIRVAFLIVSSLIVLVSFIIYGLFFSGWFLIKEIQVSGNKELNEGQIKDLANNYINKTYLLGYIKPFSNILFASSENLEGSLKNQFPVIEKANVNKDLFNKNLNIEIIEREFVGIWCKKEGDCFYFDKERTLFKNAPKFSGELFLVIEDGRNIDFKIGDTFDDVELLEKINLSKKILDDLKFIDYDNFFLPAGSFEFWIKTKNGWYIYLDKENDIPVQLVALKKILEEKISSDRRQSLEYVDLRVNGRVYYK